MATRKERRKERQDTDFVLKDLGACRCCAFGHAVPQPGSLATGRPLFLHGAENLQGRCFAMQRLPVGRGISSSYPNQKTPRKLAASFWCHFKANKGIAGRTGRGICHTCPSLGPQACSCSRITKNVFVYSTVKTCLGNMSPDRNQLCCQSSQCIEKP